MKSSPKKKKDETYSVTSFQDTTSSQLPGWCCCRAGAQAVPQRFSGPLRRCAARWHCPACVGLASLKGSLTATTHPGYWQNGVKADGFTRALSTQIHSSSNKPISTIGRLGAFS